MTYTILNRFVPNRQIIAGITNAAPAVITTTQNHGYQSGLYVRIFFPVNSVFGMQPLNNQQYPIDVISSDSFSIPIDSTNFNAFSNSSSQSAQVTPVAEMTLLVQPVRNNNNIIPET